MPAWQDGYQELRYVFAGSADTAAGGLVLLAAPVWDSGPAGKLTVLGAALELSAFAALWRRLGMEAEPYRSGRPGGMVRAGETLTAAGAAAPSADGASFADPRRSAARRQGRTRQRPRSP